MSSEPRRAVERCAIDQLTPSRILTRRELDTADLELTIGLLGDVVKPIEVYPDGTIFDGHRRMQAYKNLRQQVYEDLRREAEPELDTSVYEEIHWNTIPVTVRQQHQDDPVANAVERSQQKQDLPSQMLASGLEIEPLVEAKMRERQREGGRRGGQASGRLPGASDLRTRDIVGSCLGISGRNWEHLKRLHEAEQESPEQYEGLLRIADEESIHEAYRHYLRLSSGQDDADTRPDDDRNRSSHEQQDQDAIDLDEVLAQPDIDWRRILRHAPPKEVNRTWNQQQRARKNRRNELGKQKLAELAAQAKERLAEDADDYRVLHGDSFQVLVPPVVEDASVTAIFTDPMYDNGSVEDYVRLAELAQRVLRPDGYLLAYAGNLKLHEVMESLGRFLTYAYKFNIQFGQPGRRINHLNVAPIHKNLLWYTKGSSRRMSGPIFVDSFQSPRDKSLHPLQQPVEDVLYFLGNILPPEKRREALVLDPFGGLGTTAMGCLRLGIPNYLLCEIQEEHMLIARDRIRGELESMARGAVDASKTRIEILGEQESEAA